MTRLRAPRFGGRARRKSIRWKNRGRHWLALPVLLIVAVALALIACLQAAIDGRRDKEA